jgi:gas vesicle protein
MKDSTKRFAAGAVIAAAAGYVAGLLTAPQSGKETRQDIKDTAVRGMREAERQLKKLHTELNDVLAEASERAEKLSGKAKDELDVAVQATKKAKEAAREILSAVHEGRAEDQELQKAIKDAQKAVSHLKSYLKKRTA